MNDLASDALDREIAALRDPMLGQVYYAIFWTKTSTDPAMLRAGLPEHLRFMLALEEAGTLVASGPFFEPDGGAGLHGMSVVRAASFEEAAAIAEREPYVRAGVRSYRIWAWEWNEGKLDVSVRLGTGRYALR